MRKRPFNGVGKTLFEIDVAPWNLSMGVGYRSTLHYIGTPNNAIAEKSGQPPVVRRLVVLRMLQALVFATIEKAHYSTRRYATEDGPRKRYCRLST
jgi:hypothetical protein